MDGELAIDARADPADEAALWQRLRAGADPQAREALLARHLPYARVVAATYYRRRFHDEIEFGDYLQYASLGMLEALERFDPGRGAQFRTFAARRMHGAILDGIERQSEKQQQIAARQRLRAQRLEAARESAADQLGVAGILRGPQLLQYVAEVGVGLALAWLLDGSGMLTAAEPAETVPFYRHAELRELRQRLLRGIEELPSQERTVVRCHYLQEMPFEAVATMLQLTRGRISQIHKQALARLRERMGDGLALADF